MENALTQQPSHILIPYTILVKDTHQKCQTLAAYGHVWVIIAKEPIFEIVVHKLRHGLHICSVLKFDLMDKLITKKYLPQNLHLFPSSHASLATLFHFFPSWH